MSITLISIIILNEAIIPFILKKGWLKTNPHAERRVLFKSGFQSKILIVVVAFIFISPFGWAVGVSAASQQSVFYTFHKAEYEYVIAKIDAENVLCHILKGSKVQTNSFVIFSRDEILGIDITLRRKADLEWN